jgi:hypothetical protein
MNAMTMKPHSAGPLVHTQRDYSAALYQAALAFSSSLDLPEVLQNVVVGHYQCQAL